MFGPDPEDPERLAEALAQVAADPGSWLSQAHKLKRVADELIGQWHESAQLLSEVLENREASHQEVIRARAGLLPSSPEVYMMLTGLALENLAKGLYLATGRESVEEPASILNDGRVLKGLHGHALGHMVRTLRRGGAFDGEISLREENVVRRLEWAIRWRGRYPVPLSPGQVDVDVWDDTEDPADSGSVGYFSTQFIATIDGLFDRLFSALLEYAPSWIPWWEADPHQRRNDH